jgi:glycosyltransferase involved in cell wall biosynthesis
LHDIPLLVLGDDWGRRVSTLQHIVRRVLDHRRVVWVNGINHRAPRLNAYDAKRALEKVGAMVRGSAPRGDSATTFDGPMPHRIVPPRVVPWHQYRTVQAINARLLSRDLSAACRAEFGNAAPIIVSSTPVIAYAASRLPARALVYFCLDEYAAMDGIDPEIVVPAERRMLELADATLVTASTMLESKRPRSGHVAHVPQGVNFEHFAAPGPVDPEVAALPGPRIGFSGTIEPRLDLPILEAIAEALPYGSLILVGEPRMSIGRLAERSNVHVLARREYRDLPAVLRGFDVGLVPYTLSDWTRAVDPLKLLEYLAAGLPVVSTPLPEVLRHQPFVRIGGEAPAEFTAAVLDAVSGQAHATPEARKAYAAGHSWEARTEQFEAILAEVVARKVATD